jgi:hypothetical protein
MVAAETLSRIARTRAQAWTFLNNLAPPWGLGNRPAQHAAALLANADHAHPQPVTGCYRGVLSLTGEGIEENGFGGKRSARRPARSPYKISARNIIVDHRPEWTITLAIRFTLGNC